jgi:2-polyprenyl-6-methoxyphenol hydroxylase-like FAD-dependent oxidoreductase
MSRHIPSPNIKHAIVIGGGIAGLAAARVLCDHFECVTIVEPDHYPEKPASRPGVPQGRQTHLMLLSGRSVLEELFPGITTKLQAQGAIPLDLLGEAVMNFGEGRLHRVPSSMTLYTCSRFLIEWQIHQLLCLFPQVRIFEGYEVVGLLTDAKKQVVAGVKIRERNTQAPSEHTAQELEANLVVDASGRSTQMPQWLQELGFLPPPEVVVDPFLGYATGIYEPGPDLEHDWKSIIIQSSVHQGTRAGVLHTIEGHRWMVALAGAGRDYPPTDEAGFLEFVRSLPDPFLYTALKEARLLSKIYGYRQTKNRWLQYEQLRHLPENLVMIGDAVCAFNPVYAQGMSVALLEAKVLDACLLKYQGKTLRGLVPTFQKALAHTVAIPWQLATAADSRLPTTEGVQRNALSSLFNWYMDRLMTRLPYDDTIARAFAEVIQLAHSPGLLFRPDIVLKTLVRNTEQGKR